MSSSSEYADSSAPEVEPAVSRSELKQRSVNGGLASLTGQGVIFLLRFGSLLVLARLLAPSDFGLIAMAAAVTSFLTLFQDLGLSDATVQRRRVSRAQVSTLFWVNVGVGIAAMLACAASAPAISWFYGDTRLTSVVVALSVGLLLSGIRVQPRALLRRRMAFRTLVRVEVVAHASAVASAITAGWMGVGYWALVAQYLTMEVVATVGILWMARWAPNKPAWTDGANDLLRFGRDLTGFHLVNYAARNADDILIGRMLGAQVLGFYANAYKLLLAPIRLIRRPISNVVIPALSRLQDDHKAFRHYVRFALSRLVFVSMPIIAFAFAEADRVVWVLLGTGWEPVVPIFRVLAVAALAQSFNVVTGWSYTALGETRRWFQWGLIYSGFITSSFIVGLPWGVQGIAVAYTAATWLILVPSLSYCFSVSPLRLVDVGRSVWRALLASTLSAAGVMLMNQYLPDSLGDEPWVALTLSIVAFTVAYLGLVWLLPGGRAFLIHTIRLVISNATSTR